MSKGGGYVYRYRFNPITDLFTLIYVEKVIYANKTMTYTKVNGCDTLKQYKNSSLNKFTTTCYTSLYVDFVTTYKPEDEEFENLRNDVVKFLKEQMSDDIKERKSDIEYKIKNVNNQLTNLKLLIESHKNKLEKLTVTEEYIRDLTTKDEILAKWLEMEDEYEI